MAVYRVIELCVEMYFDASPTMTYLMQSTYRALSKGQAGVNAPSVTRLI